MGETKKWVQTLYDQLSKSFDALQTLEESHLLKGFVLTTLNKRPQVKPDLVRTDDDWEDWGDGRFTQGPTEVVKTK